MAKKKIDNNLFDSIEFDEFEWVNFDRATEMDIVEADELDMILACKVDWDSLESNYVNSWNKKQPRILVWKIHNRHGIPPNKPYIVEKTWMGMGARLFKQMKSAYESGWTNVKILKRGKSYNTQYYINEYKIESQLTIEDFKPKF